LIDTLATMPQLDRPELTDPSRRIPRAIAALTVTALLHLMAYYWLKDGIDRPSRTIVQPPVLMAELKPPAELQAPPPPVPAPPPPRQASARPVKPAPAPVRRKAPPAAPPASPAAPSTAPADSIVLAPEGGTDAVPQAEPSPETPSSATSASGELQAGANALAKNQAGTDAKPSSAQESDAKPRHVFSAPSPANLQYEVRAFRDGSNWFGKGNFRWETAAGRYAIHGEATVTLLFSITVLNVTSEGLLGEQGLAPVTYSEKPFRRSLTQTHFQHEQAKISFSASQASYPYRGGEQDRISTIWQLAGIGRGDARQFVPGEQIDLFVAGTRDAEQWKIKIIGEEEVDTDAGRRRAWHVTRTPRRGSYDHALDIWLAPQDDWHPVKIRYSYANGDWLELSLARLTSLSLSAPSQLSTPSSEPASQPRAGTS
jgi:hypothetical protein